MIVGTYRCLRCRSEAVARRRRRLKEILVAEAGGSSAGSAVTIDTLAHCSSITEMAKTKNLQASAVEAFTRSLDAVRAEASKCVLLCANCHSEVEGGIVPVTLSRATLSS